MGLFKPAWKSNNIHKARHAVHEIIDQAVLADVAKNAPIADIRQIAINKLTDQSILVYIAKNDKDEYVRCGAIEKLTDQAVLVDIAKNDKDKYARCGAVEKLTDQAVLVDIAKNDKDKVVRRKAIDKLTDHVILEDIAHNDSHEYVRTGANFRLCGILGHVFDDRCKCTRCETVAHDWDDDVCGVNCPRCGAARYFVRTGDDDTYVEIKYSDGTREFVCDWLSSKWFLNSNKWIRN